MPKAVLEFILPEEKQEFETAIKAGEYYSVLWDFQEHLLRKYKHKEHKDDSSRQEFEELKEEFFTLLRDISFND